MRRILGILLLVGLAIGVLRSLGDPPKSKPEPAPAAAAAVPAAAPASLTDAQVQAILDQGRALDKKVADSNKPRTSPNAPFILVTKDEHTAGRQGLLRVPSEHSAYPDAQKLLASIDKRSAEGEEIARKAVEKARADNVAGRKSFASRYEKELLRKGLSVTVTTEGDKGSSLRVKYVLVSKALAFNMSENHKFLDQLREVGFRKLILTDGYNEQWSLTL